MSALKKLSKSVRLHAGKSLLSLAVVLLTACQTTTPTSSSTIEMALADQRVIDKDFYCDALRPEKIDRIDYDQATEQLQSALRANAAAWVAACQ